MATRPLTQIHDGITEIYKKRALAPDHLIAVGYRKETSREY